MIEEQNKKIVFGILGGLVFLNVIAWAVVYNLAGPDVLEVVFFDVGQGDAIFIETEHHHQILIDGGPDSVILEKLGRQMRFWDRDIDLIILTHPDHDHIRGLLDVLKSYDVKNILWTGVKKDSAEYNEWLRLIEQEGADIFIAKSGQTISWSRSLLDQRDFMKILYPLEDLGRKEVKNTNNSSVVAKLVFNENSFLFMGDAERAVEKELLGAGAFLGSDVLKAGHHGSKTSSSEDFIKQVLPDIAVISVGENRFGHPDQQTLDILANYGIRVKRTDRDGDIKIISDGINIGIE